MFGAFSGRPFSVTANGDVLNTPSNLATADQVGDVNKVGEVGASGVYYDPAAWLQPVGVRFGNTGRNSFRGPGGVNLDASLFRGFPLGGRGGSSSASRRSTSPTRRSSTTRTAT